MIELINNNYFLLVYLITCLSCISLVISFIGIKRSLRTAKRISQIEENKKKVNDSISSPVGELVVKLKQAEAKIKHLEQRLYDDAAPQWFRCERCGRDVPVSCFHCEATDLQARYEKHEANKEK